MIERRFTVGRKVGVINRDGGGRSLTGYAAVFYDARDAGTEYQLFEGCVERILPTAFDDAIRSDDVRALFNHDPNQILGRNTSGTLRLSVDAVGLRYEIDLPDTPVGQTVAEGVARGDITGSSFGFVPVDTVYRQEGQGRDGGDGGLVVVERSKVSLFDVSPVTFPAYGSTSVGMRSMADGVEHVKADVAAWLASRRPRRASRSAVMASARVAELRLR